MLDSRQILVALKQRIQPFINFIVTLNQVVLIVKMVEVDRLISLSRLCVEFCEDLLAVRAVNSLPYMFDWRHTPNSESPVAW